MGWKGGPTEIGLAQRAQALDTAAMIALAPALSVNSDLPLQAWCLGDLSGLLAVDADANGLSAKTLRSRRAFLPFPRCFSRRDLRPPVRTTNQRRPRLVEVCQMQLEARCLSHNGFRSVCPHGRPLPSTLPTTSRRLQLYPLIQAMYELSLLHSWSLAVGRRPHPGSYILTPSLCHLTSRLFCFIQPSGTVTFLSPVDTLLLSAIDQQLSGKVVPDQLSHPVSCRSSPGIISVRSPRDWT